MTTAIVVMRVIDVGCLIAVPIVAHLKQRSAFGWFLLALIGLFTFLGWAVLVAVFVLPKRLIQTAAPVER